MFSAVEMVDMPNLGKRHTIDGKPYRTTRLGEIRCKCCGDVKGSYVLVSPVSQKQLNSEGDQL